MSIYLDNIKRSSDESDGRDSESHLAGLVDVYDADGYFDQGLLSFDGHGVLHMVQYYPRVDSVLPTAGSIAGGTEVVIEGGGFPVSSLSSVLHSFTASELHALLVLGMPKRITFFSMYFIHFVLLFRTT